MEPSVWLIAGPTASGKSALALRLAEALGGEVVNADSMQLYADLRVLTARPSPADERRAPHHLYGIADAAESWSAGRWRDAATRTLQGVAARRRAAIVVGGTGLYFRALTQGLAEIPPVPAALREEVGAEFEQVGEAEFRVRLAACDAAAAARIAPGDRQRLVRAMSVAMATGRSLSDWQQAPSAPAALTGDLAVVLSPPRTALYARCDARVRTMAAEGAVEEARSLMARALPPTLPAMKAIGLQAFAAVGSGRLDLPGAIADAQLQTRRYAKRQTTWFRNQAPSWPRIEALDPEEQWTALQALTASRNA